LREFAPDHSISQPRSLGWSIADAPLGLVPTALLRFDLKARCERG
jgi:hypothetical protein